MSQNTIRPFKIGQSLLAALTCATLLNVVPLHVAAEEPVFSRSTIDFGIVASDLEKSAKFYTEALGCTEVQGFDVPAAFATSLGLVDNHSLSVRVFTVGNGKQKAQIKLMSFPKAPGKKTDQTFIHSSIGISYLTFRVTDLNKSLELLKKAGVKLEGKTPVPLGGNNQLVVCRDPDGNFIELIGPR